MSTFALALSTTEYRQGHDNKKDPRPAGLSHDNCETQKSIVYK